MLVYEHNLEVPMRSPLLCVAVLLKVIPLLASQLPEDLQRPVETLLAEIDPTANLTSSAVVSEDCHQVAWSTDVGEVFVNGARVASHAYVHGPSLTFGSRPQTISYWAMDGPVVAAYQASSGTVPKKLSPDYPGLASRRTVKVRFPKGSGFVMGTEHVFLYGEGPPAGKATDTWLPEDWLHVTASGCTVYALVRNTVPPTYTLAFDGKASGGEFKRIRWVTSSPTGKILFYAMQDANGWRTSVNGSAAEPFDRVGPPGFSRDGKHVAYMAKRNTTTFLIVDTNRQAVPAQDVGYAALNATGLSSAYAQRLDGTWTVVENENVLPDTYNEILGMGYSPDNRLWFIAQKGDDRFIVLAGARGRSYRRIWQLTFSEDGAHVAYLASETNNAEKRKVVVDSVEYESDGSVQYPVCIKSNVLYYVTIRDSRSVYLVTQRLNKSR